MKKHFLWLLLALISTVSVYPEANAQPPRGENTWHQLSNIRWKNFYDQDLGMDVSQPIFSDAIKAMAGQEIYVKGYMVPVDDKGQYMVLSAFPFSQCFFCGGAGPETVMEVEMRQDRKLLNKQVLLKGKLQLNDNNFLQLIYRLAQAQLVEVYD